MVPPCTHTPVHGPRCCTPPWAVVAGYWTAGASHSSVGGTLSGFGRGFDSGCGGSDLASRWLAGRVAGVVAQVDEWGCEVCSVPVSAPLSLLGWLVGAEVGAGAGVAYSVVIAAAAASCTHHNKHTLVFDLYQETVVKSC